LKGLSEMANWRIYLFALSCVAIIVLSVAIIYASYVETILLEPVYMIVIKIFAMGVGLVGLVIALIKIPRESIP